LNGGGELFNIVPGQVFDRHAGGARQPERVDQALHAPLVDPVIDGLARCPADADCRSGRDKPRETPRVRAFELKAWGWNDTQLRGDRQLGLFCKIIPD
jgi:hypothetical protein